MADSERRLSCTTRAARDQWRLCGVWLVVLAIVCLLGCCHSAACESNKHQKPTKIIPEFRQTKCEGAHVIEEAIIIATQQRLPSLSAAIASRTCCAVTLRGAVRDGGASVLRKARVRATEALGRIASKCHLFVHFEPGPWIRVPSAL